MAVDVTSLSVSHLVVAGESLTMLRGGHGPKVLVLHDEWGIRADEEMWQLLSERYEIIAPIAPGFETTPTSPTIRTVHDLALLYNALLEKITDDPVMIIGISFGAWVALEMAVMNRLRIAHLALLGPVGLRFGPPEQRNFADLFALSDPQLGSTLYLNPDVARIATNESSREDAVAWTHNREATALFGWEPYLYTPGMQRWTEHLELPTTIVYGSEDRFVMSGYYEQFAASLPESSLVEIPKSGHFPHLDAPQSTVEVLLACSLNA